MHDVHDIKISKIINKISNIRSARLFLIEAVKCLDRADEFIGPIESSILIIDRHIDTNEFKLRELQSKEL